MIIYKNKKSGNYLLLKTKRKEASTYYILDENKKLIPDVNLFNVQRDNVDGTPSYKIAVCANENVEELYYTSAEIKKFVRNAYFDNLITQPKIQ